MSEMIKDLWPFLRLTGQYRWRFAISALLALATLVASVGLMSLSGWFISASALAGLTVATAEAFNFFTPGAGVRGFSIARTAGRYGERLVSHDATFRLLAGLRVWFFSKVEPLAPAGLRRFRQADLLNRLVADIDTLDGLYLRLLSPLLLAVTGSLALVILAALFSGSVATFLALMLGGCLVLLPPLFYRLGRQPGEQLVRERSGLRVRLLDYVAGQTELQLFGAVARYRDDVVQSEERVFEQERRIAGVTALSISLVTLLTGVTVAGVLWFGAADASTAGLYGPLVVMLVLATMAAFEAVMPLPGAFQMLGQIRRSAARLREVAEQQPMVHFAENSPASFSCADVTGALVMERVSFGYQPEAPVLKDFSLALQPGERVALVGPTGCGKSTVLQLLTRDWPAMGSIMLDDFPLDQLAELDLRRVMAVMPQRIHIFSASLRDNLMMAQVPGQSAIHDDELLEVLEQVGLSGLAPQEKLLDTWIGAAGQVLSGGEQRRLGLARVLLRLKDDHCRVVLMDEPTEGLDPETEERMVQLVNDALGQRTLLVVTHRPALLPLVSRVVNV